MSLQQKAYRGAGWSGLSGMISNGLELLKYIALARILEPGDFGLLAMAMVIISIGRIFADGGTSNAVIHFRNQSSRQLSTLFWINILAGSALYLIVLLTAPFFATFYGEPEVRQLLQLGGIILPIYAAGALFEVLIRKNLDFKKITIAETTAAVAGFATATGLALAGWGVYSLIWSHIVTAGILTAIYMAVEMRKWKPSFCFSPGEVWEHIRFGLYQMGERGLNIYSMRIDHLIIGRFFGPEILGAYHIAYQVVLFPISRLSPLLNRVALPVFAARQEDHSVLRNGYIKLVSGIVSLMMPFFIIVSLSAPWLVPFLFGDGWLLTAQLMPLMALVGVLRMMGNPSGNILLSKGKAKLAFYWNLAAAVVTTAVYLIGAQYSVFVLLTLYIAANLLYLGIGQWLLVNRIIGLTFSRLFSEMKLFVPLLIVPFLLTFIIKNVISNVWDVTGWMRGDVPVSAVLTRLYDAWQYGLFRADGGMMYDLAMILAIAAVFLITYIPLFWRYQSGSVREFWQAVRKDGHGS